MRNEKEKACVFVSSLVIEANDGRVAHWESLKQWLTGRSGSQSVMCGTSSRIAPPAPFTILPGSKSIDMIAISFLSRFFKYCPQRRDRLPRLLLLLLLFAAEMREKNQTGSTKNWTSDVSTLSSSSSSLFLLDQTKPTLRRRNCFLSTDYRSSMLCQQCKKQLHIIDGKSGKWWAEFEKKKKQEK